MKHIEGPANTSIEHEAFIRGVRAMYKIISTISENSLQNETVYGIMMEVDQRYNELLFKEIE